MSESENTNLATKYKKEAEELLKGNNVEKAFSLYMLVLHYKPEWKNEIKKLFTETIYKMGLIFEYERKFSDIFVLYENVLQIYHDSEIIYNNLGAHCFRIKQFGQALELFRYSLQLNQDYLPAFKNCQIVISQLMERWHFRMLNDCIRNDAYQKAIFKKVKEGFTSILDIGTGTGLLSLYAIKAGALDVCGCDCSKTMIEVATQILKENFPDGSPVVLINKYSNDLVISKDIPKKLSLIITETFDGGLLGEHILETLIHAWNCLLEPRVGDDGTLVNRVLPIGARLYGVPIESFKVAQTHTVLKSVRLNRNSYQKGLKLGESTILSSSSEPYDTENLRRIKGGYKALSSPLKLLEFNFNDPDQLKAYYEGTLIAELNIKIVEEGFLDAVAVWFDLILDSETKMTSSPFCYEPCSWEQAIFPFGGELYTSKDDILNVSVSCKNGVLALNVPESKKKGTGLYLPPNAIRFLNSEKLMFLYTQLVEKFEKENLEIKFVLDLTPFPYLGLLLARDFNSNLVTVLEPTSAFLHILKLNGISEKKIICQRFPEILEYFDKEKLEFDVILTDILETTGEFNEEMVVNIPRLRSYLKQGGIFMPTKYEIWSKLIYSEQLQKYCQICNDELDQLKISKWINEYQVINPVDINLNELDHEEVSSIFKIGVLDLTNLTGTKVNTFLTSVTTTSSRPPNAILYWIQYELMEGFVFDSICEDSYMNQCAFLLQSNVQTEINEQLQIRCDYQSGSIRFRINNL